MTSVRLTEREAATISFTVPLVPPSVNAYVRHGFRRGRLYHSITPEAEKFKEAVAIFGRGKAVNAEAYEVKLRIYLGYRDKGDIDNFPKCVLDGLKDAGIIRTDAAVDRLLVEKFRDADNPRTEITVKAI